MILHCPACQTQFKVDPALLGADGRTVRCSRCKHAWRGGPDGIPVQTGQFGMKPSRLAAASAAAAGSSSGATAAPAAEAQESEPASKTVAAPAKGPEPEPAAAGSADAASGEPGQSADGGAIEQEVSPPEAQKRGRRFKFLLLLLGVAVVGLFVAGLITGRIGPAGLSLQTATPTTGDVRPPEPKN
ncbi:MAG: zinc-ribbon domain-containing protein [Rhodospirillales bacterium]|nr:MAG: zinc-ribbon domain-containing protein [Rhodospirillales bacterium]